MSTPHVVARLAGATKRYGKQTALDDLNLELPAGEILALLGPNGAGKSTAIGLLLGLLTPDAGRAEIFSEPPRKLSARRRIGAMLQEAELPDALTVRELLTLHASYYPSPLMPAEALELAGLESLGGRRCHALSGGQKQRVRFALAICGRPELLILDEPTVGMDADARRQFWQCIRAMADAGTSILLTTHYLEEADRLAQRIALIDQGRLAAVGRPEEIKARVAGRCIRCTTRLPREQLAALPGVQSLDVEAARATLRVAEAEPVVRLLLERDPTLSRLEVSDLALEDAVLALSTPRPIAA